MSYTTTYLQKKLFDVIGSSLKHGELTLITPNGKREYFKGTNQGVSAEWHIHSWSVVSSVISRGDIGLGETYARGLWDTPNLENLFQLFILNMESFKAYANGNRVSQLVFRFMNTILRRNSIAGSRSNISAHYDVGNEFYQLWLDETMTYSSALYNNTTKLSEAQKQKYHRILDRIGGDRKNLLEIGCGWGGFAEESYQRGHQTTAITVSKKQYEYSQRRLVNKASVQFQDYRKMSGMFDAIASIEMFEAVGKKYWPVYFSKIKSLLSDNGVAVIQTITMKDDEFDLYEKTSDYIRHYVFPGGLLPSKTTFKLAAEQAGLCCKDIFSFGQDYARTLREWLQRFDEQQDAIIKLGYNDSFIRSWRLYLSMCAASFATERTNVMQVELSHQ